MCFTRYNQQATMKSAAQVGGPAYEGTAVVRGVIPSADEAIAPSSDSGVVVGSATPVKKKRKTSAGLAI